ncbi:hypothetical protein BamIOP4010DRAFT_3746 [Burkholderia ambifaria IOP40-10]|uniref:Uncharacterized protein n=1 Tax=Burkholderia ambifaria IOP40-10 TaxID=396596 RepID=B1FI86_9BURK|nr:hypothetical protein BamIOP4010DRAFT_3746 [Burkholderia ambifaria IOP40-10]
MMFAEDLVDPPFAVPNSLFPLVVRTYHLVRERCDFTQLRNAVNRSLSTE